MEAAFDFLVAPGSTLRSPTILGAVVNTEEDEEAGSMVAFLGGSPAPIPGLVEAPIMSRSFLAGRGSQSQVSAFELQSMFSAIVASGSTAGLTLVVGSTLSIGSAAGTIFKMGFSVAAGSGLILRPGTQGLPNSGVGHAGFLCPGTMAGETGAAGVVVVLVVEGHSLRSATCRASAEMQEATADPPESKDNFSSFSTKFNFDNVCTKNNKKLDFIN